jgi:glyoxylase-like metal-dependent hydrolase (beta-lactamase superfamily II)
MTATQLGPLRPTTHRFTLGEAEVTTILEGAHLREGINPPFATDMSADQIAAAARANNVPADRFQHTYTVTLINTGKELVLFDTGFGAMQRETGAGLLRARLGEAGYAPEDIDIVAFTHMHPDHIAGVMEGDAPAFPNARYAIGRREYDEWNSGANIPAQREQNREMFLKLIPPLAERMTFLEDGDSVAAGVTAEAAFGHSLGHMMYRLESGGKSALVWGDVTNHYVFSLQHPESPVAFDDDKAAAAATRKRVLDMVATDGLLVSGFHMPFPALGYVERHGGAYRWMPATYQLWV